MIKKVLPICILLLCCVLTFAQEGESAIINKDAAKSQKIKVFPNPATNVVNILGLINSDKADILISDVYGNVMLKHQWRIKNNALNIPIVTLNTGIYIVTIRSQKQHIQTKFYKK